MQARFPSRNILSGFLFAAIAGLGLCASFPARAAEGKPRVVVLGFDGADARLTEEYMERGMLPNLARLKDQGTYAPLGTTTPPQTPVSWSSFATGQDPGKNGIFDFLRRDLDTYYPDFAMYVFGEDQVLWGRNNHYLIALALLVLVPLLGLGIGAAVRRPRRGAVSGLVLGVLVAGAAIPLTKDLIPYHRPTVENTRQGKTFWEIAGEHGIRSRIVRVPATFPPRAFDHGDILAGLGVPDLRATIGTFSFYTTDPLADRVDTNTEMGGKIIEISLLNGEADSYIFGPRNKLFDEPEELLPPIHFKVNRDADPVSVTITTSTETKTVALGTWSDWFTMEFPFNPLVKAYGIGRFHFVSAEPFGLLLSPINFDPHRPPFPISEPHSFSGDLADEHGLYKTVGWAMETWALNELRIDEAAFLEDAYFAASKYAEIMEGLLEQDDFQLFVQIFELQDRVGHMFWRLLDPEHPAYDAKLAAEYGDAIPDAYRFMDRIVGEAMKRLRDDDVLLICSDHGFHTWHKTVNYNTWLVKNGYMTLKNTSADPEKKLEDLFGQGEFWPNVDWKRTKAYALGLGDVYINVQGRESQGIVLPGEEYDRIREQLIADLEGWIDPENGDHPVRRAIRREDAYAPGFDPDLIPDLLVANNPKYRVSWQTSLGGIPKDVLEPNRRKWSGDHCSLDPEITKGIFFANRRLDAAAPSILDLFPTILGYLDLEIPGETHGHRLVEVPAP